MSDENKNWYISSKDIERMQQRLSDCGEVVSILGRLMKNEDVIKLVDLLIGDGEDE